MKKQELGQRELPLEDQGCSLCENCDPITERLRMRSLDNEPHPHGAYILDHGVSNSSQEALQGRRQELLYQLRDHAASGRKMGRAGSAVASSSAGGDHVVS